MGIASRKKHERRFGRTVSVWNERTQEFEVFHGVTVSDLAVEQWVAERWISRANGHPDRPPDSDTDHVRNWKERSGDPRSSEPAEPLAMINDLVALWFRPFRVARVVFANGENLKLTDEVTHSVGLVQAALVREGAEFVARWMMQGGPGTIRADEKSFESEDAARKWILDAFDELPGAPDEPTFVDVSEMDREMEMIAKAA